jgi:hypothetical protein
MRAPSISQRTIALAVAGVAAVAVLVVLLAAWWYVLLPAAAALAVVVAVLWKASHGLVWIAPRDGQGAIEGTRPAASPPPPQPDAGDNWQWLQ